MTRFSKTSDILRLPKDKEKLQGPASEEMPPGKLRQPFRAGIGVYDPSHPFAESNYKVMEGRTELGKAINTVAAQLNMLPDEDQTESIVTFRMIHGLMESETFKENLRDIEFTRDDVRFLLTTKVGNLMRRPLLHMCYAEKLDHEVQPQTEAGGEIKDILMPLFRGAAWSRFVDKPEVLEQITAEFPDAGVFVDFGKTMEEFTAKAIDLSLEDTADVVNAMHNIGL